MLDLLREHFCWRRCEEKNKVSSQSKIKTELQKNVTFFGRKIIVFFRNFVLSLLNLWTFTDYFRRANRNFNFLDFRVVWSWETFLVLQWIQFQYFRLWPFGNWRLKILTLGPLKLQILRNFGLWPFFFVVLVFPYILGARINFLNCLITHK